MQKRKIEDSKIFEAYSRLISGESLTKIAASESINLNKATLRKYIEEVVMPTLSLEQKAEFKSIINKNFRGNSTENKRKNRNGKKESSAEYTAEQIKKLAELGVTGEQIEQLYGLLRTNKHTAYARDTFMSKCIEHFTFFNSIGICTQEAFEIFMRDPKAFTSDTKAIEEKYLYYLRKCLSKEEARDAIRRNPRGHGKKTAITDSTNYKNTIDASRSKETSEGRGED